MAIQWIADAVAAVKPSTIKKCFTTCGFPTTSSNPVADPDDEDDIPLARLLETTSQLLNLPTPPTEDHLQMDADLQVEEDYSEGWEDHNGCLCQPHTHPLFPVKIDSSISKFMDSFDLSAQQKGH